MNYNLQLIVRVSWKATIVRRQGGWRIAEEATGARTLRATGYHRSTEILSSCAQEITDCRFRHEDGLPRHAAVRGALPSHLAGYEIHRLRMGGDRRRTHEEANAEDALAPEEEERAPPRLSSVMARRQKLCSKRTWRTMLPRQNCRSRAAPIAPPRAALLIAPPGRTASFSPKCNALSRNHLHRTMIYLGERARLCSLYHRSDCAL
ncbi:hypothetical protein PARPLA_00872 [Rhodobacteraceae bacterium THAF1]|nr:hypothetical protein FIU81_00665 [Palleronia sp. THAF1]VDC19967.1 hypothetical protein PARPLA_00872 [Rhodobacteraceae bacterium THAF1]